MTFYLSLIFIHEMKESFIYTSGVIANSPISK